MLSKNTTSLEIILNADWKLKSKMLWAAGKWVKNTILKVHVELSNTIALEAKTGGGDHQVWPFLQRRIETRNLTKQKIYLFHSIWIWAN